MKHKALYFEVLSYTPENRVLLDQAFDLTTCPDPDKVPAEVLASSEVVFAPLGYLFDQCFMDRCPRLKVIATNTTGVPHIDVSSAVQRGIAVVSLKDESAFLRTITPTAELTLGLIVAVTRNLIPAARAAREGQWSRWNHGGARMLSRMTVGVIGLGRLGSMVARILKCMGATVGYHDPFIGPDANSEALAYRRWSSPGDLIEACDLVTLHVPMNDTNRGMLGANEFARFRPGSYFVNTARGELIDNDALLRALKDGRIAGAALDVLDGEFTPGFATNAGEHPLVQYAQTHDNLILTPHIGGSTRDAWAMTQEFTIRMAIEKAAAHR